MRSPYGFTVGVDERKAIVDIKVRWFYDSEPADVVEAVAKALSAAKEELERRFGVIHVD